jgi:uroporphyrinogen-III synthase
MAWPAPQPADRPLAETRIALPETRRLDIFQQMLTRRGATVIRCPLVSIHDNPNPKPVHAWLDQLMSGQLDRVILYTGEGIRRLAGFAERAGRHQAFVAALARTFKLTRGPKPVKALRELGLRSDMAAEAPTTEGVVAALRHLNLNGQTVGVQLYGQKRNAPLEQALVEQGATAQRVHPYVYASAAENQQVAALIRSLAAGGVEVLAITASAQVDRLWQVARQQELEAELRRGLDRVFVAAVGPVAGQALIERGLTVDAMPDAPFALKPLMQAIIDARQRVG